MSIARLLTQPLQVQAVDTEALDKYGNAVPGALGAPVDEFGLLEQTSSVEYLNGRETTVTRWTAYLPADSTVTVLSYITADGQRFQVDGEPWHVHNPRTRSTSHIVCKLTEVT